MLKIGMTLVIGGGVAFLVGASVIVYSQTRSSPSKAITEAFDRATSSSYPPVVAVVNGTEISGRSLAFYSMLQAVSLEMTPTDQRGDVAVSSDRELLDGLIDNQLAFDEASARGLVCGADEAQEYQENALAAVPPDVVAALAAGLDLDPSQFKTSEIVVDGYAKLCAIANLHEFVTRGESRTDFEEADRMWRDFRDALRRDADIEIVDPSLR